MKLARSWAVAAAATIVIWCGLELGVRRADVITDDWQGWRQADTQAIARNLAFEELDPLRPRIDWRGDGPGYVETELQLYPLLAALAMRVTGESPVPGQLISLLSVALAAALLFRALARRFGGPAAYVALLATLANQGVVVAATSIQPDTLSFLAFTVGFLAFADWLDRPTRGRLVAWVAATAIAGLVKPTTLELGLAQGLLVLASRRDALRRPALWIGWAVVLGAVVAFLLHARTLYVDYGNTFGVLSGGDSKLPALSMLTAPQTWIDLARFIVVWGIGIPAIPAAIVLLWRRRLGPEELALAAAMMALSLLALRYTSGPFGTHYHLPHAILGAWLIARATRLAIDSDALRGRTPSTHRLLLAAAALLAALLHVRAIGYVRGLAPEPETEVGELLAASASPDTLVVVRARAPRRDPDWKVANNFEDPRVFYTSRTRGWVLPNDEPGAALLAEYAARGARFYAHVNQHPIDAELRAWLDAHATRVAGSDAGEIYQLATK